MNDVSHYSQEREALKALYVFADGSRWRMKSKWSKDGGTSMNFGDMYGVEVASSLIEENNNDSIIHREFEDAPEELGMGAITSLNLSKNNMNGKLHSTLGHLSGLRVLNLSDNSLMSNIPESIGKCKDLKEIDLSNNQISGRIPRNLSGDNLTNLTILNLSNNKLSFLFGEKIGSLITLKELYLHNNELSGTISPNLETLINLEILTLGCNDFTGDIPAWIGDSLKLLRHLDIGINHLTGNIPINFSNLIKLQSLNVSDNELSGQIPKESLITLTRLKTLDLSENKFDGRIPNIFRRFSSLTELDLSCNKLSGEIPASAMGMMGALQANRLHQHQDQDRLHEMHQVRINISRNEGLKLPEKIEYLGVSLVKIDIESSSLVGQLPLGLSCLHRLHEITLQDNDLDGEIPTSLVNTYTAAHLRILNLSKNRFTGEIPESFSLLKNLRQLNLSNNRLSGSFRRSFRCLTSLASRFDLPAESGGAVLNVARNRLYGWYPRNSQEWFEVLAMLNTAQTIALTGSADPHYFAPAAALGKCNKDKNSDDIGENNMMLYPGENEDTSGVESMSSFLTLLNSVSMEQLDLLELEKESHEVASPIRTSSSKQLLELPGSSNPSKTSSKIGRQRSSRSSRRGRGTSSKGSSKRVLLKTPSQSQIQSSSRDDVDSDMDVGDSHGSDGESRRFSGAINSPTDSASTTNILQEQERLRQAMVWFRLRLDKVEYSWYNHDLGYQGLRGTADRSNEHVDLRDSPSHLQWIGDISYLLAEQLPRVERMMSLDLRGHVMGLDGIDALTRALRSNQSLLTLKADYFLLNFDLSPTVSKRKNKVTHKQEEHKAMNDDKGDRIDVDADRKEDAAETNTIRVGQQELENEDDGIVKTPKTPVTPYEESSPLLWDLSPKELTQHEQQPETIRILCNLLRARPLLLIAYERKVISQKLQKSSETGYRKHSISKEEQVEVAPQIDIDSNDNHAPQIDIDSDDNHEKNNGNGDNENESDEKDQVYSYRPAILQAQGDEDFDDSDHENNNEDNEDNDNEDLTWGINRRIDCDSHSFKLQSQVSPARPRIHRAFVHAFTQAFKEEDDEGHFAFALKMYGHQLWFALINECTRINNSSSATGRSVYDTMVNKMARLVEQYGEGLAFLAQPPSDPAPTIATTDAIANTDIPTKREASPGLRAIETCDTATVRKLLPSVLWYGRYYIPQRYSFPVYRSPRCLIFFAEDFGEVTGDIGEEQKGITTGNAVPVALKLTVSRVRNQLERDVREGRGVHTMHGDPVIPPPSAITQIWRSHNGSKEWHVPSAPYERELMEMAVINGLMARLEERDPMIGTCNSGSNTTVVDVSMDMERVSEQWREGGFYGRGFLSRDEAHLLHCTVMPRADGDVYQNICSRPFVLSLTLTQALRHHSKYEQISEEQELQELDEEQHPPQLQDYLSHELPQITELPVPLSSSATSTTVSNKFTYPPSGNNNLRSNRFASKSNKASKSATTIAFPDAADAFRQILVCLSDLLQVGIIHCFLTPHSVLRFGSKYKLCDVAECQPLLTEAEVDAMRLLPGNGRCGHHSMHAVHRGWEVFTSHCPKTPHVSWTVPPEALAVSLVDMEVEIRVLDSPHTGRSTGLWLSGELRTIPAAMWAAGCLFYQMVTRHHQPLFDSTQDREIIARNKPYLLDHLRSASLLRIGCWDEEGLLYTLREVLDSLSPPAEGVFWTDNQGNAHRMFPPYAALAVDLLWRLLQPDPDMRPTSFLQVLSHPFLTIDWQHDAMNMHLHAPEPEPGFSPYKIAELVFHASEDASGASRLKHTIGEHFQDSNVNLSSTSKVKGGSNVADKELQNELTSLPPDADEFITRRAEEIARTRKAQLVSRTVRLNKKGLTKEMESRFHETLAILGRLPPEEKEETAAQIKKKRMLAKLNKTEEVLIDSQNMKKPEEINLFPTSMCLVPVQEGRLPRKHLLDDEAEKQHLRAKKKNAYNLTTTKSDHKGNQNDYDDDQNDNHVVTLTEFRQQSKMQRQFYNARESMMHAKGHEAQQNQDSSSPSTKALSISPVRAGGGLVDSLSQQSAERIPRVMKWMPKKVDSLVMSGSHDTSMLAHADHESCLLEEGLHHFCLHVLPRVDPKTSVKLGCFFSGRLDKNHNTKDEKEDMNETMKKFSERKDNDSDSGSGSESDWDRDENDVSDHHTYRSYTQRRLRALKELRRRGQAELALQQAAIQAEVIRKNKHDKSNMHSHDREMKLGDTALAQVTEALEREPMSLELKLVCESCFEACRDPTWNRVVLNPQAPGTADFLMHVAPLVTSTIRAATSSLGPLGLGRLMLGSSLLCPQDCSCERCNREIIDPPAPPKMKKNAIKPKDMVFRELQDSKVPGRWPPHALKIVLEVANRLNESVDNVEKKFNFEKQMEAIQRNETKEKLKEKGKEIKKGNKMGETNDANINESTDEDMAKEELSTLQLLETTMLDALKAIEAEATTGTPEVIATNTSHTPEDYFSTNNGNGGSDRGNEAYLGVSSSKIGRLLGAHDRDCNWGGLYRVILPLHGEPCMWMCSSCVIHAQRATALKAADDRKDAATSKEFRKLSNKQEENERYLMAVEEERQHYVRGMGREQFNKKSNLCVLM